MGWTVANAIHLLIDPESLSIKAMMSAPMGVPEFGTVGNLFHDIKCEHTSYEEDRLGCKFAHRLSYVHMGVRMFRCTGLFVNLHTVLQSRIVETLLRGVTSDDSTVALYNDIEHVARATQNLADMLKVATEYVDKVLVRLHSIPCNIGKPF